MQRMETACVLTYRHRWTARWDMTSTDLRCRSSSTITGLTRCMTSMYDSPPAPGYLINIQPKKVMIPFIYSHIYWSAEPRSVTHEGFDESRERREGPATVWLNSLTQRFCQHAWIDGLIDYLVASYSPEVQLIFHAGLPDLGVLLLDVAVGHLVELAAP